jgi:hypothetical protein
MVAPLTSSGHLSLMWLADGLNSLPNNIYTKDEKVRLIIKIQRIISEARH